MMGIKHWFTLALVLGTAAMTGCNPFEKDTTNSNVSDAAVKPYSISMGVETQKQEDGVWTTIKDASSSYGFWADENDSVAVDFPATVTVASKDGANFTVTFDEQGDRCGIHGLAAYVALDESINTSYMTNNCGRTRLVVGVMPR